MSQTHSTQRNSQDGGDYMRPGDGNNFVAEHFQGNINGAAGHVQSPTTVLQANWSFSAQQGDDLSYGQYSSGPGEGPSAVGCDFFPEFVDNSRFGLDTGTIHAGGPTSPIPSQAGRPGPSTPSVLFSAFASATPQPFSQLIAPPPINQPQSNDQPAPTVGRVPAAVYPNRREPKVNLDEWTPEQDDLLWRRKTAAKKRKAWEIGVELFETFKVKRTPNVVTKRWAKLKKQRINSTELNNVINDVASQTLDLLKQQLLVLGYVETQNSNGQTGAATRNVVEDLQAKISRTLQDAAIALQNAGMSESD